MKTQRIHICDACQAQKRGVKPRIDIPHTCSYNERKEAILIELALKAKPA